MDATTRLGLVRVALDHDERLLTGLFSSGDIITDRHDAVTVPASAILADASGSRVQVVADGVVETRPVDAGLLWQERREIRDGLAAGETVITRAGAFFTTGDRVNATTGDLDAPAVASAQPAAQPAVAPPAAALATPAAAATIEAAVPIPTEPVARAAQAGAQP